MEIRELALRLERLPEWPMREARLREDLLACSPHDVVQVIERVLQLVRQRRSALHVCYVSLLRLIVRLDNEMPHTVQNWMYLAAELQCYWAAAFLSHPRDEEDNPDFAKPRPDAEIAGLTLGERKAKARKASVRELERFFPIDHPHVVEILLANPSMTDLLMVRYCARRPVAAPLPIMVISHPRWIQFPDIIDALVQNPSVPQWIVLKMLPLATQGTLQNLERLSTSADGLGRQDIRRWAGRLRQGADFETRID